MKRLEMAVVLLLVAGFTIAHAAAMILRYEHFHPFNQDFTYHLQGFWHFLHFGSFDETVYHHMDLFWGHWMPAVIPVAILFGWSGEWPPLLLIIQALLVGVSGVPLYLTARHFLGPRAAPLVLATYFLYPPLQFSTVFVFNSLVWATLCVNAAGHALLVRRAPRLAALWLFGAVLCQEIYCFVAFVLGAALFLTRRHRRFGFWLCFGSGLLFLLISSVYFPLLKTNPCLHDGREIDTWWYGWAGQARTGPELLGSALRQLLLPATGAYLARLLFPLLLIPLAVPHLALGVAALALPYCLSEFFFTREIYSYYVVILIPPLFIAFILGLARLGRRFRPGPIVLAAAALAATAAAFGYENPFLSWRRAFLYYPGIYANPRTPVIDAALALVPPAAGVMTTPALSEKLFARRELEVILLDRVLAPDAEYIVLDLHEFNWIVDLEAPFGPLVFQRLKAEILTGGYKVIYHQDGILVLQRRATPDPAGDGWTPALAADFDRAFRRCFQQLGIPVAPANRPLIIARAWEWPSVSRFCRAGEVHLPIIAGGFLAADPPLDRIRLRSADGATILDQAAPPAGWSLRIDAGALPEGESHLVLEAVAATRVDSYSFSLRRDTVSPELAAMPVAAGFRVVARDAQSPIEVFLAEPAGKRWLTRPLIREWLGETTMIDLYYPYPGGAAGFDATVRLAPGTVLIARDLAGNERRTIVGAGPPR